MTTKIVRMGNTLTVEIPEELLAQADLTPGEPVEWVSNGSGSLMLVSMKNQGQKHIRTGISELKAGNGLSHERVLEWLDRWGTGNELAAPR